MSVLLSKSVLTWFCKSVNPSLLEEFLLIIAAVVVLDVLSCMRRILELFPLDHSLIELLIVMFYQEIYNRTFYVITMQYEN